MFCFVLSFLALQYFQSSVFSVAATWCRCRYMKLLDTSAERNNQENVKIGRAHV